jgi:hypothetical protein
MTGTEPELTVEEYAAQLKELELRFPAPTWDEVKEEWKWLHGRMEDGTLDPEGKWCDRHIAVYQRRVIGTDANPLRLRLTKARELGIHPERLVITYLF